MISLIFFLALGVEPIIKNNCREVCMRFLLLSVSLFTFFMSNAIAQNNQSHPDNIYWDDRFATRGVDDLVRAVEFMNSEMYIGGDFTHIGTVEAGHIARWDGQFFQPLGTGTNESVFDLLEFEGDIYAGGAFTEAGGVPANAIARWDGDAWHPLGNGLNGTVLALVVMGNQLYAGGIFTDADEDQFSLARWDGAQWQELGYEFTDLAIWSLAVVGSDLYAGGNFHLSYEVGEDEWITATDIARWDGSAWHPLGEGLQRGGVGNITFPPTVADLATDGTNVYVGGEFIEAGEQPVNNIARWDGSAWHPVENDLDDYVWSLSYINNQLYAGGLFREEGGETVNRIARWDDSTWHPLTDEGGTGLETGSAVMAIAEHEGSIYAGGDFRIAGGKSARNIASWDGIEWNSFGDTGGTDAPVDALTATETDVYTGGRFTEAGHQAINRLARWDGDEWHELGEGVGNNWILDLAYGLDGLFAVGPFTEAGGESVNRIARWDGTVWDTPGSGLNQNAAAVAVSGENVYAGGFFDAAGGVPANRIARWDGTQWHPLGDGVGGISFPWVRAIALSGTDLYAAGDFAEAGGEPANNIARWDGTAWHALGDGVNGRVNALAVNGTEVYAAGSFTTAGNEPASRIARWDGNQWHALESGLNGIVTALLLRGADLYAGGRFTETGDGQDVHYIARWDGSQWHELGDGIREGSGTTGVRALTAAGRDLYAGGNFQMAGDVESFHFARWFGPISAEAAVTKSFISPTPAPVSFDGNPNNTGISVSINSQSGGGTTHVHYYDFAPSNVTGVNGIPGDYFWIIRQEGFAEPFQAEIRIDGSFVDDPEDSDLYWRPTHGSGSFIALPTAYDVNNDELVAAGVTSFGEFVTGPPFMVMNPPEIAVVPDSVEAGVAVGDSVNTELIIINEGEALLSWNFSSENSDEEEAGWIRAEPSGGAVTAGDSTFVTVTLDASDLSMDVHQAHIRITSNDPDNSEVTVPVELTVGDAVGIVNENSGIPDEFALMQNYPNPFNPVTVIEYQLPADGEVRLEVFDMVGRRVAVLIDELVQTGYHDVTFDASGMASGVYIYRLQTAGQIFTKKLTVIK